MTTHQSPLITYNVPDLFAREFRTRARTEKSRNLGAMAHSIENRKSKIESPCLVGVIGLGPLWQQQYQPALAALNARFRVTVVCDQIEQQAIQQAKQLNCIAASGPTQLLEDQ